MPSFAIPLLGLALAPFAVYFAVKRPLIFPLGLYIMMVPFDSILGTTTTVTRIVAIVTAAALLFHIISRRQLLAPPPSWTAWAAFALLSTLTALWTIDPTQTMLVLGQVLQLFFFYTLLAIYPAERKEVRLVGAIVVASGFVLSAFGLALFAQGVHNGENRLSIELNGLWLDPNHFSGSLLMPIALALGALLETRDGRLRFIAGTAAFTMVAALFFTGSRGGLIALAVMLLYIAWKTRYRFSILALMALFAVGSLLQPTVWTRFTDKGDASGSGRFFIWDVGKLAFKDHWLLGAGIGSFPTVYNHEIFRVYQPVFQGLGRPAHNAILAAAVELGFLGAILLVYAWWRTWSDARGNVVIEATLVGLAIAALFLDVIVFKYFWLAFGMAALVKNAADPALFARRSTEIAANHRAHAAGARRSLACTETGALTHDAALILSRYARAVKTTVVQLVATMRDGGAEAVLRGLLPLLALEPDLDVHVVSVYDPRLDPGELRALGVPVHSIGRQSRGDVGFAPRLVSTLRRLKPHIVHGHIHTGKFVGRMAAIAAGVPHIVFTEHGDEARGLVHWTMSRILNARTSRFIVFTEDERRRYAAVEHIPLSRVNVIGNGIPAATPTDVGATRAELGLSADDFAIVVPARLAAQKNQQLAIRAVAAMRAKGYQNLRLMIVGDGADADALRALSAELAVADSVSFLGYRNDAKRLVAACNLMLLPSLWEKMPLVLGEAMLAGVPVASAPWIGVTEFIDDGETGYIASDWTVDALATTLARPIDDPAHRATIIATAAEFARARFDLTRMVRSHTSLYRELDSA